MTAGPLPHAPAGPDHFKKGILKGPGVDEVAINILEKLLEVALTRRSGYHSSKRLADYTEFCIFETTSGCEYPHHHDNLQSHVHH